MSVAMPSAATPQSLVEHALSVSTADDCIVIARDHTSANLRWANNTLTTNGVMHGISVTVISFIRSGDGHGHRLGQRQRYHPGPGRRAGARRGRCGPGGLPRRGRERARPRRDVP